MTTPDKSISIASLDEAKIDLIKRTLCKGLTNDELELFIHACNRTGLDPFMKQIYAIKRGGTMTIQTAIDGFRVIAERTGRYVPGREPTFAFDSHKNVISATCYVKKMDSKGNWHEIGATAYFSEYSANNSFWQRMPCLMIAKCAEALALRKAFPADLSGIYTSEEMEQADFQPLDVAHEPSKCASNTLALPAPESEPPYQPISEEENAQIEANIPQDESYRKNLLAFFSTKIAPLPPLEDFKRLPKASFENCMKSILRKKEDLERQKKTLDKLTEEMPF